MSIAKLEIGDQVQLCGNPFDEQIPEELLLYMFLQGKIQRVTHTMVPDEEGTSGLWIRTDMMPDWTDATWFVKL